MSMTVGAEPLPGRCFAVEARLGEGAMGTVYEAVDLARQQRVALKVLRRLEEVWPRLARAGPLRSAFFRMELHEFRARAALRAMVLGRLPLRPRQVEADIRKLEGEGSNYALRVGALLRADLAAVRGEPGAVERYAQAAAGLEEAGLHVHAAAARLRQGELLGGSEGAVRAEAARGWMRERGGLCSPMPGAGCSHRLQSTSRRSASASKGAARTMSAPLHRLWRLKRPLVRL